MTIGDDFPVNTSIKTKALNRLSYAHPLNHGFDVDKLKVIDSIAMFAINNKMTPGAQILVARNGVVVYNKSFGKKTYESKDIVMWNDLYDLASLTKILSTVPLMMNEFEKENLTLETTLSDLFPDKKLKEKSDLNIKEMFSHQSGLFPWIPFYKKTLDSVTNKPISLLYKNSKNGLFTVQVTEDLFLKESFLDSINLDIINSDLLDGKSYVYSDLPYYFMKSFLENTNNSDLDIQLKKKFYLN